VLEGEAYGLNGELMEVLNLLPPGLYTRDRLCGHRFLAPGPFEVADADGKAVLYKK